MRFQTVFLLVMGVALAAAAPAHAAEKPREGCSVCGMWIDQYRHTRHVLVLRDRTQLTFCSLACAGKYLKEKASNVVSVQAADYLTADLVDARKASYVLGSDVPPVMSSTSTVAFACQGRGFIATRGARVIRHLGRRQAR